MPSPKALSERYPPVGLLMREWRTARRMSQLDLALECDISARHLGFIETGKANPSREAVGRIADALSVALRERNALLLAAGYAPVYEEANLAAPELGPMRQAVALILKHQNPFPAFVINRHFDVLDANEAAASVSRFIMAGRESRHGNLLRQIFDPDDLRPVIANWNEVASWFLRRLQDEITAAPGNDVTRALFEEMMAYPGVPAAWRYPAIGRQAGPVVTIDFRSPAGTLRFFETITTFAAPLSVTLDDLRIDCTFPVDDATTRVCEQLARGNLG